MSYSTNKDRIEAIHELSQWILAVGEENARVEDSPHETKEVLGEDAIQLLIDAYRGEL